MGEVGKGGRFIEAVADPLLLQCVGGDLHHAVPAPLIPHLRIKPFQLHRLGSGVFGVDDFGTDLVLDGADQPHHRPVRLQHLFDEVRNGGLPLGAGDADEGHAFRRVAEESGGRLPVKTAGVARHKLLGKPQRLFGDGAAGPFFEGGGRVFVPVRRPAPDGDKQIAGVYLPGVAGNPRHLRVKRRCLPFPIHAF